MVHTLMYYFTCGFLLSTAAGNATDNVYFSANFKTTDTGSYDISFQQVDFNDSLSRVETSRLYGWLQGNTHWLNCESR